MDKIKVFFFEFKKEFDMFLQWLFVLSNKVIDNILAVDFFGFKQVNQLLAPPATTAAIFRICHKVRD